MADFCTVADLEALLQIEITEAAQVASAARAIREATAAIRNYCHQHLELVTNETITLDSGPGTLCSGTRLFLPELPVQSVAEVVEDDEVLTPDDDYKLGQWGILHRVGRNWAAGVQLIEVTYSHGHATLPDDVIAVCARAAARAFQAGLKSADTGGVPGISATSLGDYSVSYAEPAAAEGLLGASGSRMLLMSEKDVLNRYRYVPA